MNVNKMDVEDWNLLYYLIGDEMAKKSMPEMKYYQDLVMGNDLVYTDPDFHTLNIDRAPQEYHFYYENALKEFNKRCGTDYSWHDKD